MILATNKFEGHHAIFILFVCDCAYAFFLQTYYVCEKLVSIYQLIFHAQTFILEGGNLHSKILNTQLIQKYFDRAAYSKMKFKKRHIKYNTCKLGVLSNELYRKAKN
jgi:hypothetical protein